MMSEYSVFLIVVLCVLIYVFWVHSWLMGKLINLNRKATNNLRGVQIKQIRKLIKAYDIKVEELYDE